MDGERIRKHWSSEALGLLATYKQFETLVPASIGAGADHRGEDGRYVEDLIREYLRRHLPKNLEALTGFIVRPAVKTGTDGRERKNEKDTHSSQLDIIIYDTSNYPVFQRFADNAVVVPEGVIGIISVKKTLRDADIKSECSALSNASKLCSNIKGIDGKNNRGPYLALVSASTEISKKKTNTLEWVFKQIESHAQDVKPKSFDQMVGYIGVLDRWSIFKRRPTKNFDDHAHYIGFEHNDGEEHLALQFLLTGILSVYYDESRSLFKRPGFTAFPNRNHDKSLGKISVDQLR